MDEKPTNAPETSWSYAPEAGVESNSPEMTPTKPVDTISWTASEFVAHEKGMSWFVGYGVISAIIVMATFLITQDIVSPITISVVAIAFGVFAVRKPRTLPYVVDETGVHIDKKTYTYDSFKSFALIQEGGIRSITLMPLKRFMPSLSIYMDPADEEKIVNVLGNYLPIEERQQELIDRLMRRLRF